MVVSIRSIVPVTFRHRLKSLFWKTRHVVLFSAKRPYKAGETSKARSRRERERFFDMYCTGRGLDIGYGGDPIVDNCDVWDAEHGDAQSLSSVKDASYDFVYSSHTLEHMQDPAVAVRHWWRVVVPGGFLILYIPDRDLYEKRTLLPSRWNDDHRSFFLLERDEEPDTLGVLPLVSRELKEYEIILAKRCHDGHTIDDPLMHSDGEYSIEVVLHKLR